MNARKQLGEVAFSNLALLRWNGSVTTDEFGEDTSECLNTKGEWSHV